MTCRQLLNNSVAPGSGGSWPSRTLRGQALPDAGSAVTSTAITERPLPSVGTPPDDALDDGAPAVGKGPTPMVGNVPISMMCNNVPEVQAGPACSQNLVRPE
jgi:hypothetical protein